MNVSGWVIKKDSELVAGRLVTKFESGRFSQSGSTFETMNPLKEGWVGLHVLKALMKPGGWGMCIKRSQFK